MRLGFVAVILLPTVVQAQMFRDSTISVAAAKTTRIQPDRASMYVLVEGSAETAADAVARADTKLKAVTDAIRALGSRVETDRAITFSVGPAMQPNAYPNSGGPPSNVSRNVLRVTVTRLDQVPQVAAAALGAGASGMSAITYESSVADSVRRSRMAELLAVARALATALEGKLGGLVDVSSSANNFGYQGPMTLSFDTRFMQPTQVPEVAISTSVNVRYRLVR